MKLNFTKEIAYEHCPPMDLTMFGLEFVETTMMPRHKINRNSTDQFRADDRDPKQVDNLVGEYKRHNFNHKKPRQWSLIQPQQNDLLLSGWQRDEAQDRCSINSAPYDRYKPIENKIDYFLLEQAKIEGNNTSDHEAVARANTANDALKYIIKCLGNGWLDNKPKEILTHLKSKDAFKHLDNKFKWICDTAQDSISPHPTLVHYAGTKANSKAEMLGIPHSGDGLKLFLGWVLKNKPSKEFLYNTCFSYPKRMHESRYFTFYIRRPNPDPKKLREQRLLKIKEFNDAKELQAIYISVRFNVNISKVRDDLNYGCIFNHFLPSHDYEEEYNSLVDVNGKPIKSEHLND